jgi:hypothetical protein
MDTAVPNPPTVLSSIYTINTRAAEKEQTFPKADIFFASLGKSRGLDGSVREALQHHVEQGVQLAKSAKAAGVSVYVLISSSGASALSSDLYLRAQRDLEEEVQKLGFRNTVLVQPDFADSKRPSIAKRFIERFQRSNKRREWLRYSLVQDAEVIAKAAVFAAYQCAHMKSIVSGLWTLDGADIVKLGETEWKKAEASRLATAGQYRLK